MILFGYPIHIHILYSSPIASFGGAKAIATEEGSDFGGRQGPVVEVVLQLGS